MKKLIGIILLAIRATTIAQAQWSTSAQQNLAVRDLTGTSEVTPLTTPAPAGGTWVSWFESVPGTNYQMRLQLLDATGTPQLGTAGLLVSSQPQGTALYRYDLQADAAGNAILAFQDTRSGNSQAVVYKVSPTGQQLWGVNGIQLLDPTATSGLSPTIGVLNSGNIVVAWNASGTGSWVAFQKFSPTGTALWTTPQRVQAPPARFTRGVPLPAGPDDVLLEYVQQTGFGLGVSTVFAQRYDANGAPVWATPTQVSDKTIGFAFFPKPIADGAGGYFVLLNSGNPANANLGDVYVQHVTASGSLPWGSTGTEVLTGTATARSGGAVEWIAARNELWVVVNELTSSQGSSGFTLQRLDPALGTRLLGATGQPVQPVSANYYAAQDLRSTGSGLLIPYTENTSALHRTLWATRVNYQGQAAGFATSTGSVLLSGVASAKLNYSTLPFRNGQLVTVWEDERNDRGIYAQTVSDDGRLGVVLGSRAAQPVVQMLQISPNPHDSPSMHLQLSKAAALTISVRDLTGRLVSQLAVEAAAGAVDMPLPATGLAAGVYLVEARGTDSSWHGRWVKP